MKSNAPWSVKGIARDTRETAKQAARKEGMTVGEWLNQIIHRAGSGDFTSGGAVSGIELRDIVTAIEHLNNKLSGHDEQASQRLDQFDRNIGGVIERIQRLERTGPATGPAATLPDGLEDRLTKLEHKTSDTDRIGALRALEKAVSQVAAQFDRAHKSSIARLETNEQNLHDFTGRLDQIDSAIAGLSTMTVQSGAGEPDARVAKSVLDLTRRLTHVENSAAAGNATADPHFAERTGKRLRVLGDEIKRSGDQIGALETLIGRLADQIDAAEQRSSDGVQKVTEAIASLQTHIARTALSATTQDTNKGINDLDGALFDDLTDEIEAVTSLGQTAPSLPPAQEPPATPDQAPDQAMTASVATTPTGSLYEEDDIKEVYTDGGSEETEETIEGDFDSAFDDIDFSDDSTGDLDSDDAHSPAHAGDIDIDLDAEDIDAQRDTKRITAEINQLLGETAQPRDKDTADPDDLIDPLAVAGETIATPHHQENPETEASEDDFGFGDLKHHGSFKTPAPSTPAQSAPAQPQKAPSSPGKLPRTPDGRIDLAKLTPKQRAVLAARARKKRAAAAALANQQEAPQTSPPARAKTEKNTGQDHHRKTYDNHDEGEPRSLLERARALLPFGSKDQDDDHNDAIAQDRVTTKKKADLTNPTNADTAAPREHTNTSLFFHNGKPTLPLIMVGIFLLLCLVMFMQRPLFTRDLDASSTPTSSLTAPRPGAGEAPSPAAADSLLETPPVLSDTLRPRQMFLESMAILGASPDAGASIQGPDDVTNDISRTAFQNLVQAASFGYPPAQFQLGEFYKNGTWTEQDSGRARTWFQRAAIGGNIYAMHRLGYLYAEGEGGSADIITAIQHFEQAANLGFIDSQYNLGAIYDPGPASPPQGIQDIGKAYYWYALAALNGDNQAGNKATDMGERITSEQKTTLDEQIADWRAQPVNVSANENLSES